MDFEKYGNYWPVIAGTLAFLFLGLVLYLLGERAMERSRKRLSWVKGYRKSGFPYRKEVLSCEKRSWLVPVCTVLLCLLVGLGPRMAVGLHYRGDALAFLGGRFEYVVLGAALIGAISTALLLQLLFDSAFVSLVGAFLFVASPVRSHTMLSFLMLCLLLLVCYLRTEKPGFPAELFYLAAIAAYALTVAMQPRTLLFVPAILALHWYKLIWHRRSGQLKLGALVLALLAALLFWAAIGAIVVPVHWYLSTGVYRWLPIPRFGPGFLEICLFRFLEDLRTSVVTIPTRGMLLSPMLDAPLLGLGAFGALSALGLAGKRRNIRGLFSLLVLGITVLVWLVSGCYTVTLGLLLCGGCLLKNCEVGGRRLPAVIYCVLGVVYYVAILAAGWFDLLVEPLVSRISL